MSARVQTEKRVIQKVRKPRQRMPVCRIKFGERPFDRIPIKTAQKRTIFVDIGAVVNVYKVEINRLRVNNQARPGNCDDDWQRSWIFLKEILPIFGHYLVFNGRLVFENINFRCENDNFQT